MKKIFYLALVICMSITLHAQNGYTTTSGRVIGNDSIPLPGVAVIMQNADSVYLDATITNADGHFSLKHPGCSYILLFQHIAYCPYSIKSSTDEIGTIVLQDAINKLQEVAITAQRPLVKVRDNKLIYDVEPLMKNRIIDNAFDLLKELPSIRNNGDLLTINGAIGTTHVIINGKSSNMSPSQLNEYLKSLPAERISKAEIVYNAPPQWHVKGAAINIILKENNHYTLQGQMQGKWENAYINSYSSGGSLFASNPKLSFDVLYNYKNDNERSYSTVSSLHTVGTEIYDIESNSRKKSKNQSHNIYSNINYKLDGKSNLSLSYNGQISPDIRINTFSRNNMFSDAYSHDTGNSDLHDIRLTYDTPFGLNIGTEYTQYKNQMLQDMLYPDKQQDDNNTFTYNRKQKIKQGNLFADMSHTFSSGWKLNYGAKYEYTKNTNTHHYSNLPEEERQQHNTSETKEKTVQVYAGASKSFFDNKLSIELSLLGEIYKINDYKKNGVLPNATITYIPTPKHIFQLSYNTLRRYPSYWQRQDYISYEDEYSVSYGNPVLRPDKTSYVNLVYVLNNKYIIQLSYYKVDDFFISQSYQSPQRLELMHKAFNIDYTTAFNASVIIPIKIGEAFNSNITATAYNERYKNNNWFDISYDRNKWTGVLMAENTLVVSQKPKITINAMAFYRTPTIQGIWNLSDNWAVNTGAKCSLAKGKFIINFQCDDIFQSMAPKIKVRYDKQNQNQNTNFYQRSFSLSFTYKFNDYKGKRKNTVDTSRFGTK